MFKNRRRYYGWFLSVFLIIFVSVSSITFAQKVDEKMKNAGQYYRNDVYDKAINIYEQLIKSGYEGKSLFYNLGNSYYRVGKVGYAILNYEKALKISPNDEDVKHNLAFARLSTVDRIQPLPEFFLFQWWETLLASYTVNGWTYLTYLIYIILLSLFVGYFFVQTISQQKFILFSGLTVLIILALSVSLLIVKVNRETTQHSGVVITQSVTVKNSPDQKSSDAFVIHEGLKIKLEDKLDQWIKIRLADGKVGWVENDSVEKI